MTANLFPGRTPAKPSRLGALARIGDDTGLHEAGGDTMLSMTDVDLGFGGKRAAPFVKGGGRSKTHPNDAKGKKRAAAKAAMRAKSRAKDYSVEADAIDLGHSFDPTEPRGTNGRWVRAAMKAAKAGDLGALKRLQGGVGADYEANPSGAMYQERNAVMGIRADVMEAMRLTDKASQHSIEKHTGKMSTATRVRNALKAREGKKASWKAKQKRGTEAAMDRAVQAYTTGLSLSNETDLGHFFNRNEPRNDEGKWRSIREPSKAQGAFLKSRNDLAQAKLEGDPKKIAKAVKKSLKAQTAYKADDAAKRRKQALGLAQAVSQLHKRQEGNRS